MAQFEWVQSGEIDLLDIIRTNWNANFNFQMKLFTSNSVINHNPSIANFVEAAFLGYAPVTISNWTQPTHPDNQQHAITNAGTNPVFSNISGAAQNVQGIFCTKAGGTPVLLGWGYFLTGGTLITIQDQSTLTIPATTRVQTIFEHSFA